MGIEPTITYLKGKLPFALWPESPFSLLSPDSSPSRFFSFSVQLSCRGIVPATAYNSVEYGRARTANGAGIEDGFRQQLAAVVRLIDEQWQRLDDAQLDYDAKDEQTKAAAKALGEVESAFLAFGHANESDRVIHLSSENERAFADIQVRVSAAWSRRRFRIARSANSGYRGWAVTQEGSKTCRMLPSR